MEPIVKSNFVKVKRGFEIETRNDLQKEAKVFECFAKLVIDQNVDPDAERTAE